LIFLELILVMVCVLDLYDEWLLHWRVCGSVVIKVENWPYGIGLYSILMDILSHVKKIAICYT
jgi:hypothetical protein